MRFLRLGSRLRSWKRAVGAWCAAAFTSAVLILACSSTVPVQAQRQGSVVVTEYDGIIHPIATEIIDDGITRAEAVEGGVAVIVLRTPGGLLDATRSIVTRMTSARVPVVVFVGPAGARAASAGFLILIAADVAAMAPGTHAGAAHPVSAGGEAPASETMNAKVTEDAAAYARTLAEMRGRNQALAAEAVVKSRAFTDREALSASPPLIDLVADDVGQLLEQLDGRRVSRSDGRTFTMATRGAPIERMEMTWRQRVLSAIAHPQIAYLLMTLGMLGLVVELWNPGSILPGVAGGLCILLAFFAFQVLSVGVAGFLLIAFGLGLMALELTVPSFGALGVGGILALFFGSVMITRQVPGVQVSYGVILPVVAALAAIFLFLGRLALRAQRMRPATGVEGLQGELAVVLTPLGPDRDGQVRVHGEIWRATSPTAIGAGRSVRVTAVEGLTLQVQPAETPLRGENP
jgi:membrane-bound serine protease (ClpP class)